MVAAVAHHEVMKRSKSVHLGRMPKLAAAVLTSSALATGGCTDNPPPPPPPQASEICAVQQADGSLQRVDEQRCDGFDDDDDSSHFFWYYIPHGHTVPSVGHKATGGSHTRPGGVTVNRAPHQVPAAGQPAPVRGGFGGRPGTGSGGG